MKAFRLAAGILYWLARATAIIVFAILLYAVVVILLYLNNPGSSLPIQILNDGSFQIFLPFTHTAFLLGDFARSYLLSSLFTVTFYGLFLWLLGGIFNAFSQQRLFTQKAALRLSRFYIINLLVPVLFIAMVIVFGQSLTDMLRITLLHIVIGIFAFFMAAIFRQGLLLQDEQDLIF